MNDIIVVFDSRSGNTAKVGTAMAEALACEAVNVRQLPKAQRGQFWETHEHTLVLLGTGIYMGHAGKGVRKFLKVAGLPTGRTIGLFATWIGRGQSGPKVLDALGDDLKAAGNEIDARRFLCFGSAGPVRRGYPGEGELAVARDWAEEFAERWTRE